MNFWELHMGDKTLMLADALHINERNFKSLLTYCSSRNVDIVCAKHKFLPIDAFGDYTRLADELAAWRRPLETLDTQAILDFECMGVNVFDTCRAELMSLLCTRPEWYSVPYPQARDELFIRIFESDRSTLLDNMAATCAWLEYWSEQLRTTPRLAYVGIFSGSLLYARSLTQLMRFHSARCFLVESFFTGLHYYMEERYSPLANRSSVALKTVFKSLKRPIDRTAIDNRRDAVLQTMGRMKNKNVQQPQATGDRLFNNGKSTVLILGQVLNDFSLLEARGFGINSLEIYRKTIQLILDGTEHNVIFKAHPWERKKTNIRRALTAEELEISFGGNPRVKIVESHALEDLFRESDVTFCVCSQGGIEAALAGFKPIQVGCAFWGGHGFSHDLGPTDQSELLSVLLDPAQWHLTLDAYDALMDWLVAVIEGWLVEEAPGARADARLGTLLYEISSRTAKTGTAPDIKAKPAPTAPQAKVTDLTPIAVLSTQDSPSAFRRKFNKLLRRPDEFFRDSKSDTLRRAGMALLGR
jgi:Capsule polysaccharide biosynthesis protein